jgi:hypothetical protein
VEILVSWKETIVVYFKKVTQKLSGQTEEKTIEILLDNGLRDPDSDLGSHEFEAEIPFKSYYIWLKVLLLLKGSRF